jgi:hypothetical protein
LIGDTGEKETIRKTGVGEMVILKRIFKEWDQEAWNGLLCFRIKPCCGLL